MTNHLKNEKSPYLKQHENNPVNWFAWNKKTLEKAKLEKKPIFLSVGYASCHWCHVMAHESFENENTAKIMNEKFINIKVDREERPDLDSIFQKSLGVLTGAQGGWPLSMFLDENAVPFTGGTYFPPSEMQGRPSFNQVLENVSKVYLENREKIIAQVSQMKEVFKEFNRKDSVLKQNLEPYVEKIIQYFDEVNGGFKGAPKFPQFYVFDTIHYFYKKNKNQKFLEPVENLLIKVSSRGIYDQIGGGIARYTVDEKWIVPHFEKMLYDNLQFILLLTKYNKIKPDNYFIQKIKQSTEFLLNNFISNDNGLLGTAYDADSEGIEGKYYVYDYEEIKNIKNIGEFFDVKPSGNWEGKIILDELKKPEKKIIDQLLEIRKKRIRPFFDSKTQLDLNCLWVTTLINLNSIISDCNYSDLAEKFFQKIEKKYLTENIFHSYSKNISFIEDYAFLVQCLLDLSDSTMNPKYRLLAKKYCEQAIKKFYIKEKKIFQKNEKNKNDIFISPIDISDNNMPNANSIMLLNFSRLGFKQEAKELADSLNGYLNIYKNFMISSVKSLDFFKETENGKNCNSEGCSI